MVIPHPAKGFGLATVLMVAATGYAGAQDTTEDVTAACLASSNMPQAICDCIGQRSTDLSPDQRGFYVATLNGDAAETERLRGVLEFAELSEVITFVRTSPTECAG